MIGLDAVSKKSLYGGGFVDEVTWPWRLILTPVARQLVKKSLICWLFKGLLKTPSTFFFIPFWATVGKKKLGLLTVLQTRWSLLLNLLNNLTLVFSHHMEWHTACSPSVDTDWRALTGKWIKKNSAPDNMANHFLRLLVSTKEKKDSYHSVSLLKIPDWLLMTIEWADRCMGVSIILNFGQYIWLKASPYSLVWRHVGLKDKALHSTWPGLLNSVLKQDTLLSFSSLNHQWLNFGGEGRFKASWKELRIWLQKKISL